MEIEARARLASVLHVCEHEGRALQAMRDERLQAVLDAITALQVEIVAALAELTPDEGDGRART